MVLGVQVEEMSMVETEMGLCRFPACTEPGTVGIRQVAAWEQSYFNGSLSNKGHRRSNGLNTHYCCTIDWSATIETAKACRASSTACTWA